MGRWRFAVLVLPLLLAGCLISDQPLIQSDDYQYPLPNQATGDAYTYDNDAKQWRYDHSFALRRAGAEYIVTEKGDSLPFVLTSLGGTHWLAQTGTSDGRYQYGILFRDDDGTYYAYDLGDLCDALDDDDDDDDFDIRKSGDDCVAHRLSGLALAIYEKMPSDAVPYASYVIR